MNKRLRNLTSIAAALTVFAACESTMAQQTTDSQVFTVTVPSVLSITAPSDQSANHDGTDNDQVFSPGALSADHWQVVCNATNGASVSIRTLSAFVHTTDGNFQRDASVALGISYTDLDPSNNPVWTTGTTTDQTNYVGNDGEAEVTASSGSPGRASLAVTVAFITDTYSTLLEGDYRTTLEGTISAN